MLEAGVLFSNNEEATALYWHMPVNRTVVSLPDSPDLWDVIWEHRLVIGGVAHSHPGKGLPGPSYTDITTFSAIELGLGRRLEWPVITEDSIVLAKWVGPGKYDYEVERWSRPEPCWLAELRRISYDKERATCQRQ